MTKDVLKKLNKIQEQVRAKLLAIKDSQELEKLKIEYLGRRGKLNEIFKELLSLSEEAKQVVGKTANKIKQEVEIYFEDARKCYGQQESNVVFDETIPGEQPRWGSLHPITQFLDKINRVFVTMGFEIVEDREVETAEYNFDKLNIPLNHPARDMWDTFYVRTQNSKLKTPTRLASQREAGRQKHHQNFKTKESKMVLRTHTSPVQLRAMETRKPPVRLIVPGRVYRHEATDASHETNFYQLEGLVLDQGVSVANMIYVLDQALKRLFGGEVKIRIRPSFFPFVEPGHEVDMSCIICEQKGCSVCSGTGWLEMLGAGMVQPVVLKNMRVDPNKYSGFAFGMGIDRLVMLYYGIDDIRLFYSGDLRFLRQF